MTAHILLNMTENSSKIEFTEGAAKLYILNNNSILHLSVSLDIVASTLGNYFEKTQSKHRKHRTQSKRFSCKISFKQ